MYMANQDEVKPNILIRVMKVDQWMGFLNLLKEFSVDKFKKLYQQGKVFINILSDTKKLLILSRFTVNEMLSFSEIQKALNVSSNLLSYDLKKMIDSGFLEKVHQKDNQERNFSFYCITDFGKKVINQLFLVPNVP